MLFIMISLVPSMATLQKNKKLYLLNICASKNARSTCIPQTCIYHVYLCAWTFNCPVFNVLCVREMRKNKVEHRLKRTIANLDAFFFFKDFLHQYQLFSMLVYILSCKNEQTKHSSVGGRKACLVSSSSSLLYPSKGTKIS